MEVRLDSDTSGHRIFLDSLSELMANQFPIKRSFSAVTLATAATAPLILVTAAGSLTFIQKSFSL